MNILIVDDEAIIREWIQYSINSFDLKNLNTDTACDGLDALSKIEKNFYDVAFIDIQMPRMNGLELLSKLKEISPQTLSIILSSHNDFEYAREAMRNHSFEYILKSECNKDYLYSIILKCQESLTDPASTKIDYNKYLHSILCEETDISQNILSNLFSNDYDKMPFFCISILNVSSDLLEQLHDKFNKTPIVSCTCLGTEKHVTYYLCATATQIDITDFSHSLSNTFPDIRFAISKYWTGISKIPISIKNSLLLLDYLYYTNTAFIIGHEYTFHDYENTLNTFHSEILDNIKHYDNHLLIRNFTSLSHWILENMPESNMIKNICANILYTLSIFAPDLSSDFFDNFKNLKSEIYSFKNFENLLDYMLLNIKRFIFPLNYSSKLSPHISKVIEYITENYMNLNSISDIAACVHLNSDYLTRLFKKETGENLNTFLMKYKLNISANLLRNTSLQISDIATQVGIDNISYFSKKFKELYGTQPINYRNKYKTQLK